MLTDAKHRGTTGTRSRKLQRRAVFSTTVQRDVKILRGLQSFLHDAVKARDAHHLQCWAILLCHSLLGCNSLFKHDVPLGSLRAQEETDVPKPDAQSRQAPPDAAPADASRPAVLDSGPAETQRDDAVALFDFSGNVQFPVEDERGTLALSVPPMADATLLQPGEAGLTFSAGAILVSDQSATTIAERSMATSELSLEIWVTPQGPQEIRSRLVSMSIDTELRNFALGMGQHAGDLGMGQCADISASNSTLGNDSTAFFFRRRWSDENCGYCASNGFPELWTKRVAQDRLTHVVATHASDGLDRLYVDGVVEGECSQPGDFADWDPGYPLQVGDELVGGDRRFTGIIHLIAIYDRALPAPEVQRLFSSGI